MTKKTILVTILFVAVITSCIKDDNPSSRVIPEGSNVTIKVTQSGYQTGTRSMGPTIQEGETIVVKNGMLYFTDKEGTITNVLVVIPASSATPGNNETNIRYDELISAEGVTLKGIRADAAYVYLFGNTPNDLMPLPDTGPIGGVITEMITMMHQTDPINWGGGQCIALCNRRNNRRQSILKYQTRNRTYTGTQTYKRGQHHRIPAGWDLPQQFLPLHQNEWNA
ncbi:MAG: hypothetical protein LUH04_01265 [Clostridium sp.]|nr:hypothetical protein [Clostridium sp.]